MAQANRLRVIIDPSDVDNDSLGGISVSLKEGIFVCEDKSEFLTPGTWGVVKKDQHGWSFSFAENEEEAFDILLNRNGKGEDLTPAEFDGQWVVRVNEF
jgi:hypothetical protein